MLTRFSGILCATLLLAGCAAGGNNGKDALPFPQAPASQAENVVPTGLPADGVQPWESLDENGHVVPVSRAASSININTDFTPGVERFNDSGDAVDNLEATRLNGTDDSATSHAIYRVSMGASQPGIVSVDANLLSGTGYYVGLSNYGTGRWDWQGPFTDNHVRLQAVTDASGDLTSSLGNSFVAVLCPAGSSVDVVGLGINQFDPVSSTAPAVPSGLTASAVPGGIELSWSPVLDNDLAGYAIYQADQPFSNSSAAGVRRVPYLEGATRHLLREKTGNIHVRIASVDFAGNESELTPEVQGQPLAGSAGIQLASSAPSGMLNDAISLTASGADSYDWDLDGDGVFEIEDDSSGVQSADTSSTGLIRPRVRGRDSEGEYVALGGLSLIISGNSRPVALATATPATGEAGVEVDYSAIGEDAEDAPEDLLYHWDIEGDGIFEESFSLDFVTVVLTIPNVYNSKLRVTDTDGAWDVDTVTVIITGEDPNNQLPTAEFSMTKMTTYSPFVYILNGDASSDPDGSIVNYEWDFNSDGTFDASGPSGLVQQQFQDYSERAVTLRVTDNSGGQALSTQFLRLPSAWPSAHGNQGSNGYVMVQGPQDANLRWAVLTSSTLIQGQPVIGPDGTIYAVSNDVELMAFDPLTGDEKWSITGAGSAWSPAVAADGSIYYGDGDGNLFAVSPQGNIQWQAGLTSGIAGAPVVDFAGNVYVCDFGNNVLKFSSQGTLVWTFTVTDIPRQGCSIGIDGTVVVAMDNGLVTAINPDGTLRWTYDAIAFPSAPPVVGPDGTVYVATGKLYAINPDGTEQWVFGPDSIAASGVSRDLTGNLVFANNEGTVYSVTPDGTMNWQYEAGVYFFGAPAIDIDGNIYITSQNEGNIYAIRADGSEIWSGTFEEEVFSGPSIGEDGTLYQCIASGAMFAIGADLP